MCSWLEQLSMISLRQELHVYWAFLEMHTFGRRFCRQHNWVGEGPPQAPLEAPAEGEKHEEFGNICL